jgi:uncharacterized delta-60 repeat protein
MKPALFLGKDRRKFIAIFTVVILLTTTSVLAGSGTLDPTFGTNGVATADFGGVTDSAGSVVLQSNGKILLAGTAQSDPDDPYAVISRFNSNGTLDTTFGGNGNLYPEVGAAARVEVAVQADGKLVIAGSSNGDIIVSRYDGNGTILDGTFGTNGIATISDQSGFSSYSVSDLAIEPDGKIVVVGTETNQGNFINFVVARFNSDGTRYETDFSNGLLILDKTNFPNNRYNYGQAVAVQTDGKIVVSGGMMDDDANGQISLVRLNPDSSLDVSTFGSNGEGTVTAAVPNFHYDKSSMVLQTDGKIVVTGTSSDDDDLHNDLVVARFNSNGALDTTFGGTGIVITNFGQNEFGIDVHMQADGRIVVVGTSSAASSDSLILIRYNANGSLDTTFGTNGKLVSNFGASTSGSGIEIQPDGRIVVAASSDGNALLARYILATPATTTFKSIGAYDGWVLESGETTNIGGTVDKLATTFNVGDDPKDKQYRGFLSFNTAALPDNAVITSVQLSIKRQGLVGTDPFTTHTDLLLDIRNSAFSNNVALQTADFSAAASPGALQEKIPNVAVNSWYTINLNNTNLGFISKIGVTQFRLAFGKDDNDDLGADYLKFFTGNSTAANAPQLVISYHVP